MLTSAAWLLTLAAALAPAATPGRDSVLGEAASLVPTEKRLVLRRDNGGEIAIVYDDRTAFLRARPGATSLEGASPLPPAELAVGDRLLCRGTLADDGARLLANRVVVMTRSDVETRRQREREDWQKRGLAGIVASVDPQLRAIGVRVTQGGAARTLTVEAGAPGVAFRRYAPASVRFADAQPGEFADLAAGDQIRVLGNRSPDGTRVVAEQVVSGAFRVVRGLVSEVDPTAGTLVVREAARGASPVPVVVSKDTLLRRLPPMMVARLLRGGEAASPAAPADAGRAPDPDEALERLPAATLAEVNKGDEVAVLGPKRAPAQGLPAIKLVAWTTPSWPSGARGTRGRGEAGAGSADPFSDLLGAGGDTSW